MPALRRKSPSDAPVSMLGMTAAPGHIAAVMLSIGSSTSGTSGDGGDGTGGDVIATCTPVSLTTRLIVATTLSGDSSGSRRQLMFAPAVWGRALLAWPPSSRVATHVVRRTELSHAEPSESRRIAVVSPDSPTMRIRAAIVSGDR